MRGAAGGCAPAKIYDATAGDGGTTKVGPIAVGHGLSFFFATTDGNQDNRLYSCPVATGCTTPPNQLVVRQYSINAIEYPSVPRHNGARVFYIGDSLK